MAILAWAPADIFVREGKPKKVPHKEKKATPLPHSEKDPHNEKKKQVEKWKKNFKEVPPHIYFFQGVRRVSTLASPLRAPKST